jgi:predicted PurR-regulated permease PerM
MLLYSSEPVLPHSIGLVTGMDLEKTSAMQTKQPGDGPAYYHRPFGPYFLTALLFASVYLVYKILSGYLNTIIISVLLALLFHPIHSRILVFFGNRRVLAALCSCALILILVIAPLFFLGGALIDEGVKSFNSIYDWVQGGGLDRISNMEYVADVKDYINQKLAFIDLSTFDLQSALLNFSKRTGQFLLRESSSLVSNVTRMVVNFFLMIFIVYYLLKDGAAMAGRLMHAIPLSSTQKSKLSERIQQVTKLTFFGTVLTAIAQGIVGGIGLAIAGFPGLFWGTIMAFTSLIPIVGTALIWVPAALYLAFIGRWGMLIFFILWNVVLVGSIDNFLRPRLIGGEGGMSPLFILLAILGGIEVYGIMGLVYGPLILGLCGVLIYLYELENEGYLTALDKV